MTFKVLQCNEYPHKRNIVVHRGVVVPRSLTAIWYNSALAPKSDTYFPYVQLESGATIKNFPLGHQGTVDPPNITIPEGGGKRHKPSISPPKVLESDQSTSGSNEAVVDGTVTVDGFTALSNLGDVNENEKTDDMDWDSMGQEDVQDQHIDADVLDICPIDILSCNWKTNSGKLMIRITGLNGLGEDAVEAEDVKVDYSDKLALYLIDTSIGLKNPGNASTIGWVNNGKSGL